MKKLGWLLLITLILIGICSSALAINGGDNISSAVQINLNTYYTDNLISSSTKNYYKFTLPSAGVVSVGFKHEYMDSSSSYWIASIIDINDNVYSQLDHAGNKASEEISVHYGLPAGTYYFKVAPYVHTSVDYTFRIIYEQSSVWETEINDTISKADPISVNTYYNGMIRNTSDRDFYRFTLPSAGYVTVGFRHEYLDSSSDCWVVKILDIEENVYSQLNHKGNKDTEDVSIRYGLPAGTYYVEISPYVHTNVDYQFIINYTQSSVWETELNNSITTADPIKLKTYYNGNLRNNSDYDYYKFTLTADGYVTIKFKHEYIASSSKYWILKILNAEEKEYANIGYVGNEQGESSSLHYGLPAGTYYIKISNYLSSNLDYAFKVVNTTSDVWETEFNDSITTADPIKLDTPYNGIIRNSDDKDFYSFNVPKDGIVSIFFKHGYIDTTSTVWKLYVIDAQEKNYYTATYAGNVSKEIHSENIRLKKGTYYIKVVYGNTWSGKDYKVTAAWDLVKTNIATATVTVKDQTYTGSALKPAVTVKVGTQKLVKGTDYTVAYKNNKAIGKATVTITGTGRYEGTATATFLINPKAVKLTTLTPKKTKLTVAWKKGSNITGYEIEYSLKKDFSSAKKVTIKSAKTTSRQILSLKQGKTYYVRIRTYKTVGSKKYYSDWSSVMKTKMLGTAANDEEEEPIEEFNSPHN